MTNTNNDFLTLTRQRYSCRKFLPGNIEMDKLKYILECARLAPSAVNFQPWCFVVLQTEENRLKIQSCYDREWFRSAPVYIIACGNHSESWKRKTDDKDFCDIDTAIAIEHICLAATEQGLGSCWVCNFDTDKCREMFAIPTNIEPIAIIPIGYPEEDGETTSVQKKRKAYNDIIKWEKF